MEEKEKTQGQLRREALLDEGYSPCGQCKP